MCSAVVSYLCLCNTFGTSAHADLEFAWQTKDVQVNAYEAINLFRIDLRGMTVEFEDEDEGGTYTEGVDHKVIEDIANEFYARFTEKLEEVLPLVEEQTINPARKSLIVELTLTAPFIGEERGLLMNTLLGNTGERQTTGLTFQCLVKDSQTDALLLRINDTKEFSYQASGSPLASEQDFNQLRELIGFWARSLAGILNSQKS